MSRAAVSAAILFAFAGCRAREEEPAVLPPASADVALYGPPTPIGPEDLAKAREGMTWREVLAAFGKTPPAEGPFLCYPRKDGGGFYVFFFFPAKGQEDPEFLRLITLGAGFCGPGTVREHEVVWPERDKGRSLEEVFSELENAE